MKTHRHLDLIHKYSAATKRATLTHAEKTKMREELLKGIQLSPAHMSVPAATPRLITRIVSPYVRYLKSSKKVVAPLLLVLLIGGGTSYAAESSLPGDLLYPVKIHVNENVFSGLSFSTLSKAQWAVNRVARRLQEAKAIGLKAAVQEGLNVEVQNETITADSDIAALNAQDPSDAKALSGQLSVLLQDVATSTQSVTVGVSTSTDTTSVQVSPAIHLPEVASPIVVPVISPGVSKNVVATTTTASTTTTHVTTHVLPVTHTNIQVTVPTSPVSSASAPIPVVNIPTPAVTVPVTNAIKSVTSGNGLSL